MVSVGLQLPHHVLFVLWQHLPTVVPDAGFLCPECHGLLFVTAHHVDLHAQLPQLFHGLACMWLQLFALFGLQF